MGEMLPNIVHSLLQLSDSDQSSCYHSWKSLQWSGLRRNSARGVLVHISGRDNDPIIANTIFRHEKHQANSKVFREPS